MAGVNVGRASFTLSRFKLGLSQAPSGLAFDALERALPEARDAFVRALRTPGGVEELEVLAISYPDNASFP